MKTVISKLRENLLLKKILYWTIAALLAAYAFTVPTFPERFVYAIYASLIGLGVVVIIYIFLYKKFVLHPVLVFIPLFIAYAFIGTAIFSKEFRGWLTLVLLGVSFFICFYSFHALDNKRLVMNLILLGLFAFSLYFIYHYRYEITHYSEIDPEESRIGTYFDNQNGVAACCLVGFVFAFYLFLYTPKLIKLIYLLPIATITITGLTTQSRSFVFGIMVVVVLMMFLRMYHHKLLFVVLLGILIAAFFLVINIPFLHDLKVRLDDMFNTFFSDTSKIDYSSVSRTIWLDYGLYLGSKNIICGYGFKGFAIYSGVETFTHSNISEVLCDFGLPGTFIFYSPYVILSCLAIKKKLKNITFVLPVFLLYVVVSFSMVFFYDKIHYIILPWLYYLELENKYEYNRDEFISKNRIFNNVLLVVDENDYQSKEVDDIYQCLKTNSVNSVTTLVYGKCEAKDNVFSCEKTNFISKMFAVKALLRKHKINTVISVGNKNGVLTYYALVGRSVTQIPVILDSISSNMLPSALYARRSAILFNTDGTDNKNIFNASSPERLQDGIDYVIERKAYYDNSFDWK